MREDPRSRRRCRLRVPRIRLLWSVKRRAGLRGRDIFCQDPLVGFLDGQRDQERLFGNELLCNAFLRFFHRNRVLSSKHVTHRVIRGYNRESGMKPLRAGLPTTHEALRYLTQTMGLSLITSADLPLHRISTMRSRDSVWSWRIFPLVRMEGFTAFF